MGRPAKKAIEPCEGGCTHTQREHEAFDSGLRAGERGKEEWVPLRFQTDILRDGWLTGFSVGQGNREGATKKSGGT